ncbi:amino acid ABC transporter ATP-binding protein, partial [Clostridioides difficile]
MNRIEVSHLIKNYGSNEVLKDLDLTVGDNEVVVMIGPSGSGKSTFLRCLNRLEEPTSGEIIVDGYNLSDPKSDLNQIREKIGMVFQHFNLFKNLTVAENITLAPVELGKMTPAEAKETAKKLLETVGLSEKFDAKPQSLSGGQKQ